MTFNSNSECWWSQFTNQKTDWQIELKKGPTNNVPLRQRQTQV
jgi:hypothetical protein